MLCSADVSRHQVMYIGIKRKMVNGNTHHWLMSKVSKQIGKEVTKSA